MPLSAARSSTDLSPYGFRVVVHAVPTSDGRSRLKSRPLHLVENLDREDLLPAGSDAGSIVSEFSPYGVWAHELGHQTGHLPDMYDLPDSSLHFMGTWSLDGHRSLLGQPLGNRPGLFDAWSRASLGGLHRWWSGAATTTSSPETPPSSSAQGCCYALEIQIDSARTIS